MHGAFQKSEANIVTILCTHNHYCILGHISIPHQTYTTQGFGVYCGHSPLLCAGYNKANVCSVPHVLSHGVEGDWLNSVVTVDHIMHVTNSRTQHFQFEIALTKKCATTRVRTFHTFMKLTEFGLHVWCCTSSHTLNFVIIVEHCID